MTTPGTLQSLSTVVIEDVIGRCSYEECQFLLAAIRRRQDEIKLKPVKEWLKEKICHLLTMPEATVEFQKIMSSLHPRIFEAHGNRDQFEFDLTMGNVNYVLSSKVMLSSPFFVHQIGPTICINKKDFSSDKAVRVFQDGTFYHIDGGDSWIPPPKLIEFIRFIWDHGFWILR